MNDQRSAWERFFDGYAGRYMGEPFVASTAVEADFIETELSLQPGDLILDLGCGTGRHAVELARRGYRVTGVDLSSGMLGEARAAAAAAGVEVTWIKADATSFHSEQRFDAALCLCEGSLGLLGGDDDPVEHDLAVLNTMARALRPGGGFLITVLNVFRSARTAPAAGGGPDDPAAGPTFDPASSSTSSVMSWADGDATRSVAVRERSFTPTELSLLCRVAGLDVEWVGGGTAGYWGRRPLELDEHEIMALGRRRVDSDDDEGEEGGLIDTRARVRGRVRRPQAGAPGTLYICATPIGNLGDVTLRVLQSLESVRLIAAEDTRHARKLLSFYDIHTPLTSLFAHNEAAKTEIVLDHLRKGHDVALMTDAGMPGIADPGTRAVTAAVAAGAPVTVLPGASAPVTALVASGLGGDRPWCFVGFLPRRVAELRAAWLRWQSMGATLVCFETPVRLSRTLRALAALGPETRAAVCRELTKLHEEIVRGTLAELADRYAGDDRDGTSRVRGELTLVLDLGAGDSRPGPISPASDPDSAARRLLQKGLSRRDASLALAVCLGMSRRAADELVRGIAREAGG